MNYFQKIKCRFPAFPIFGNLKRMITQATSYKYPLDCATFFSSTIPKLFTPSSKQSSLNMFARLSSAIIFVFLMFTIFPAVVCLVCTTVSNNPSNIQDLDRCAHPRRRRRRLCQPMQHRPHPVLQLCSRGFTFVSLIYWKCLTLCYSHRLPLALLVSSQACLALSSPISTGLCEL